MSKPLKRKKEKVPKISEEEYAAYIALLKSEQLPPSSEENANKHFNFSEASKSGK